MTDKKYNVVISDKAANMLAEHVRFLALVSKNAAIKLKNEIISEIKALESMPESYPVFYGDNIPINKYRRKLVSKRYLIIYLIKDNDVFVDYVLDCRQDYAWLL